MTSGSEENKKKTEKISKLILNEKINRKKQKNYDIDLTKDYDLQLSFERYKCYCI